MPPPDFWAVHDTDGKGRLLFRTKSRKDNPEAGILQECLPFTWYFKQRIQEIEGIGIERDLAGRLPVIYTPQDSGYMEP